MKKHNSYLLNNVLFSERVMKVTGKIIEKVEENWWALVTNSQTLLIHCEVKLTEGVTYTFIKPEEEEKDVWRVNKQLKPLKSKEVITNNIDEKKKEKLLIKIKKKTAIEKVNDEKEPVKTFQEIFATEATEPNKPIKKMIGKVIRNSDISGQYGNYSILELKDTAKETISINLYKKLPPVKQGDVIVLENTVVGKFKKDDEQYHRCQTTSNSKIRMAEGDAVTKFTDILIGDVAGKGTVLGVNKVHTYSSCSKCKKKVENPEEVIFVSMHNLFEN